MLKFALFSQRPAIRGDAIRALAHLLVYSPYASEKRGRSTSAHIGTDQNSNSPLVSASGALPGLRSAMLEWRRGTLMLGVGGGVSMPTASADAKSLLGLDDTINDDAHEEDDDNDDSLASAVHRAAYVDNPRAAFRQAR